MGAVASKFTSLTLVVLLAASVLGCSTSSKRVVESLCRQVYYEDRKGRGFYVVSKWLLYDDGSLEKLRDSEGNGVNCTSEELGLFGQ